jgi:hypothetical protein
VETSAACVVPPEDEQVMFVESSIAHLAMVTHCVIVTCAHNLLPSSGNDIILTKSSF